MNSQSVTPWLQDKSLWLTVLGILLPPLSAKIGMQLSPDKIAGIAVMVVAFIVAHKAKSWSILKLELEQAALSKAKALVGADPLPAPPVLVPK